MNASTEHFGDTLIFTLLRVEQDPTDTIIALIFDKPVVGLKAVDASKGVQK